MGETNQQGGRISPLCRIIDLHHIVIRFSLLALFLWPCFSISDYWMCLFNSKETIEARGIILDLKPIGVRLCQFASG